MPEVTIQTCYELAALVRVAIDDKEAEAFASQLERVMGHLDRLQEVDVQNVPEFGIEAGAGLRDDTAGDPLPVDVTLSMAPRRHSGHVMVPKFKDD